MPEVLWTSGTAFVVALVLTPIIRDIFHAYNVVDRPGFRKVHAYPIPRLGGIAVGIAYVIALVRASDSIPDGDVMLWTLLPGAGVIFLIGVLDDFFNLPPLYKLSGQIAAAVTAYFSGVRIDTIAGSSVPLLLSLPITVFWLLLLMNALNLIDGLDGLCAGMGLVSAIGLYAVASIQGNIPLQYSMLPLAGALLGFLCYNFNRATMFLGDSGALLIGLLIGSAGIMFAGHPMPENAYGPGIALFIPFLSVAVPLVTIFVPLMVIFVPLMDVMLSIARRFLSNRPIFKADRGHIHHRLLDSGLTARRAVLVLYLWAAAGAGLSVLMIHPVWRQWQGLILAGFCVVVLAGVQRLRYSEFTMAQKLLFGGEFRKTIGGKARVQTLGLALQRAKSEDEWWDLLVDIAREAGWAELTWMNNQTIRRKQIFPTQTPGWAFNVVLPGPDPLQNQSLQIQGALQVDRPPFEIMDFAQAVHGAFSTSLLAWEPSGRS